MTQPDALPIECIGETLWLLPERALWWPAARVLFVADVHLGKAAAYRALGQPVPAGTTRENIDRLCELMKRLDPARIVFLGDFLHAAESRTPSVLRALSQWRCDFSSVHCTLVRGNHDSRAGDPPKDLQIDVVDEPWLIGPFAACHHPQAHATHLVIAGHLHPVVHLHGRGREHLRLPCFMLNDQQLVLPAFGEFTGGFAVSPAPGLQLFPSGGGRVWRLPV